MMTVMIDNVFSESNSTQIKNKDPRSRKREIESRFSSSELGFKSRENVFRGKEQTDPKELQFNAGSFEISADSAQRDSGQSGISKTKYTKKSPRNVSVPHTHGESDFETSPETVPQQEVRTEGTEKTSTTSSSFDNSPGLPEHEPDTIGKSAKKKRKTVNFLKDKPYEMTYGRRIAMSLINKTWYNPRANGYDNITSKSIDSSMKRHKLKLHNSFRLSKTAGATLADTTLADTPNVIKPEQPSLAKAWAYFEHVALTRYIADKRRPSDGNSLERAMPGEKDYKTRLYDPIHTPHNQLGDFGLGVGLYFSTLRAIIVMTLIAGIINIPNIVYFASEDYMPAKFRAEIPYMLHGSAICLDRTWVPCPECDCDNSKQWQTDRCATVDNGNETLTFTLRNNCKGAVRSVFHVNFVTLFLMLLFTMGLGVYLYRQETEFDEDEQTARDYSIVITNPPPDAHDPEEWRQFFHENCDGANVTVCTCAVSNDLLVRTLAERREVWYKMKLMLEPGTVLEGLNLARLAAEKERKRRGLEHVVAQFLPGVPELYARILALNGKVEGMAQLDYPVKNVFVTFETEEDQRHVLSKLSVGKLAVARNDITALEGTNYLFRGEKVLDIHVPEEPDAIRWQDLNSTFVEQVKVKLLTLFCTFIAIVVVAFIVWVADQLSIYGATATISFFNLVFPEFAKILTRLEHHKSEGTKQTSLYVKIACFRWVNTAIVITLVTPFTKTLDLAGGLIPQIYAIFFSEIITTNLIQLSDAWGHFRRHILGPRAPTQDAMNHNFTGEEFELAERYTNMTKILFLTLWYCVIYPAAFFMCAFALFINYYTDRFSLMRSWRRSPQVSTIVSKFSRAYFFNLALIAMVIMSSYFFSGFGYDNLCANDAIDSRYIGTFTVEPMDGQDPVKVTVSPDSVDYRYCAQDPFMRGTDNGSPFLPRRAPDSEGWMTQEQEKITTIYRKAAFAIIFVIIIKFVFGWIQQLRRLYTSNNEAVGEDQGISFSDVHSISAYIPQVVTWTFSYPLIASNIDGIHSSLFDWADPDRPHSYYDLTKDAHHLLNNMDLSSKNVFSSIKHWNNSTGHLRGIDVAV